MEFCTSLWKTKKMMFIHHFTIMLLRIAMSFSVGEFSKWAGIGLNILIYVFITVFIYLILKKMLSKENILRLNQQF